MGGPQSRGIDYRTALRGIREQENEDISEITQRASRIYISEEPTPCKETYEDYPQEVLNKS